MYDWIFTVMWQYYQVGTVQDVFTLDEENISYVMRKLIEAYSASGLAVSK